MAEYHVLVKLKKDGSVRSTSWQDEREAKSSVNALVTLEKDPAAIVVYEGKIIYEKPPGILDKKPDIRREFEQQPIFRGKSISCNVVPSSKIPSDAELIRGAGNIPQSPPPSKPQKRKGPVTPAQVTATRTQTEELLYAACKGAALAKGKPLEKAIVECDEQNCNIDCLATSVDAGEITLDQAYERIAKATGCLVTPAPSAVPGQGKRAGKAPAASPAPVGESYPGAPPTLQQVQEWVLSISETLLSDGGTHNPILLREPVSTINSGLLFLVTEESGEALNRILSQVTGSDPDLYHPEFYIKAPEQYPQYAYLRVLDLTLKSKRDIIWVIKPNKWVPNPMSPTDLISQIQEQFTEDQVKILVFPGVSLA